jgi:dimethylhistidine N-methyltransferase
MHGLLESVRAGLCKNGQKELHCKYLYDDIGSALFEVISLLPEYGLTRAGDRLLRMHAAEVAERVAQPAIVVELGSGSCKRTPYLLNALADRGAVRYCPIEISPTALGQCRQQLSSIGIRVTGYQREYLDGLAEAVRGRISGESVLVLFLGSTIGNFERLAGIQFLQRVRRCLIEGDAFLVQADLVKPEERLLLAYDDPLGVTASFNKNLLARLNRELGANFVLTAFEHAARYDAHERRVEMHLRSLVDQHVTVAKGGFTVHLREGETIWTESSHKYTTEEVAAMAAQSGFRCETQWVDTEWPFTQALLFAE